MSARAKLILAVVATFLVCLLLYFFMIRPRNADLGRVNDEIDQAEQQTTSLRTQLGALKQLQDDSAGLQTELAEIRELVPETNSVANFVLQVQDAATASGVGFVQITPETPKAPPEGAPLAQVRAVIGAKGGYFAIQDFVRRVTDLDRAVRIDSLTISGVEDEEEAQERGRTDMSMNVRIFFELPEQQASVNTGEAPTTPPPSPAPAAGETPAPGSSPAAGETPAATPAG
jgi:Tfp pilus assembly protein PilO